MTDDQYRRLIINGVAKINCYTGLADATARVIRDAARKDRQPDYGALLSGVRTAVLD